MSIKLGPAAESIVRRCGCQMRPVLLINAFTWYDFAMNRSLVSCFVNGILVSRKSSFGSTPVRLLYSAFVLIGEMWCYHFFSVCSPGSVFASFLDLPYQSVFFYIDLLVGSVLIAVGGSSWSARPHLITFFPGELRTSVRKGGDIIFRSERRLRRRILRSLIV